jgi:hypothetical protein
MAEESTFETIYAQAGDDLTGIPWASLRPMPALVDWLDRQPPPAGQTALVVACGLGDDAEEVSRRGYRVTAFDLVVEIRTLQSLPVSERPKIAASVAGTVTPGGRMFVHGLARRDDETAGRRPWPISPQDLSAFTSAGLTETELKVRPASPGQDQKHIVDAVYTRLPFQKSGKSAPAFKR